MKYTTLDDGLDVYIPDEELPEIYRIIYLSSHNCDAKDKLLTEIGYLMSTEQIKEIRK